MMTPVVSEHTMLRLWRSNVGQRAVTALVLAPLVLGAVWAGGLPFAILLGLMAALLLYEWVTLTLHLPALRKALWWLSGALYTAAACWAFWYLRGAPDASGTGGAGLVTYILLVVWATDIGAYAVGRTVGGPKLLPSISPSKTWAGLAGGMVCAALVSALVAGWLMAPLRFSGGAPGMVTMAALGAALAVVAQAGDFFESWMKRRANRKDSGTLLPGHGGMFDRVDGLLPAVILWAVWVMLMVSPQLPPDPDTILPLTLPPPEALPPLPTAEPYPGARP